MRSPPQWREDRNAGMDAANESGSGAGSDHGLWKGRVLKRVDVFELRFAQIQCYSWITGVSDVAQVVFVRKRLVEIQYLRTTITDKQRHEFAQLVESTIRQIEGAQFLPHSGIRFPQNPCSSCPYIGLCLGRQELVEAALIRRPGAEQLDWLDELNY